MTFDEFKASPKGKLVCDLLDEHDWQIEMICLSKHGLPAAQAVGAEISVRVGELDDTEKQHVGRCIRDVMAEQGWKVATKGARVAAGNYFTRAAIYRRIQPCVTLDDPIALKMKQIVQSPEGVDAAVKAAEAGYPAMAGIDPLLSRALGDDYGKHNLTTATAGDFVANLMRSLGYKESGRGKLPPHCVARTAALWVKSAEPVAAAA